ncbi:probable ATP-dependent RNA helicase DDX31 [Mizuhopecten yessoensis]|uniref:ATP-dependent RNA helicase n=1 Tax=Mizuhopecten yessoensis TaxID=6573 RepID=A0A210QR54_MIZYE|nr:probable ATP-dependent RNA helicase DDX31 [Mizuhopecten yessoensis]OWF51219.1 ATP-dependent RNA helicase DDX31 [Mizuhopecten yessoensis]
MTDGELQLNVYLKESETYREPRTIIRRKKIRPRKTEKSHFLNRHSTNQTHDGLNLNVNKQHEEKEGESREEKAIDTGQHESNKRKASQTAADADPANKKQKIGPIISSLFSFNPHIPHVESVSMDQIKEVLFSSKTFKDLGIHPHLVSTLENKMEITQMTSVQQKSIPHIMIGADTLVKSQTGSGKTLAFAVPIVQALQALTPKVQRNDGPYALVVVPTRELALQCLRTFEKILAPFRWIVPGCIIGGEKRKAEKARLRKGINILVCTPGRLIDHIRSTNCLSLRQIKWLVLDEADRMLDMGYEKDIAQIINSLNMARSAQLSQELIKSDTKPRQTVLLSATLSEGVQKMAGISLTDPVRVDLSQSDVTTETNQTIKTEESSETSADTVSFSVPENLKQHFIITPCKLRLVTLAAFIVQKCKMKQKTGKMLVFLPTQGSVEFHYAVFHHFFGGGNSVPDVLADLDLDHSKKKVETDNLDFFRLHGEMAQKDRASVYQNFSKAKSGILFCTDVACRGLDLPNVRWIVQYTPPGSTSDYVHRIGRTARAGNLGHSLLFLMPSEVEYVPRLNQNKISLEELQMNRVLDSLLSVVTDIQGGNNQRELPRTSEEAATYLQMCVEEYTNGSPQKTDLAVKGFQSFVKAYATYPSELKSIFHIKHLHLGHLAKSFGLRESPSKIKRPAGKAHRDKQGHQDKSRLKFKRTAVSEFGSGLGSDALSKFKKNLKGKTKHKMKN